MATEIGAMFVAMGQQPVRGDTDYIRRRRLGGERVYGITPGRRRQVQDFLDDFDLTPLDWMKKANCRDTDPEAFFPELGEGVPQTVRAVCDSCPVQQTCLDYALERPQLKGIWGGLGDQERARILKTRGQGQRRARRHAAP